MSAYRSLLSSFAALYGGSALPSVAFDAEGRIAASNRAFAQLVGADASALEGQALVTFIPLFRDAASFVLRAIPTDHTTVLHAHASIIPVSVHYSVLHADEARDAGGLAHVIDRRELLSLRAAKEEQAIALEASEARSHRDGGRNWLEAQKRVEHELTQANAFLEDVLETLSDGMCITDAEGHVARTNGAFARLLGKSRQQIEGGYIYDLWPLEGSFVSTTGEAVTLDTTYRDRFLDHIGRGFLRAEGSTLTSFEVYAAHQDGRVVPVELCMALRFDASGVMIGGVGTARDLTERRKAERERLDAALRVRDLERENLQKQRRIEDLSQELEARYRPENMIGESATMRAVYAFVEAVRDHDAPVLISGETGTGKELVARAIHYTGRRKRGPLVCVNCGAIPKDLVEAELFGHVRGAYTGALRDRTGHFEAAHGGTLFLDEIGEMSLEAQVRLLRVLADGHIQRVGDAKPRRVNVRLICATNRDLTLEVKQGRFREDLYYRVHVLPVMLPPLRQRTQDLEALCARFVERFEARYAHYARKGRMPSGKELRLLSQYAFPGNVRELEHIIERYCLLDQPMESLLTSTPSARVQTAVHDEQRWLESEDPLREAERAATRRVLRAALARTHQNHAEAARLLGIARSSLYRKLQECGLEGSPEE